MPPLVATMAAVRADEWEKARSLARPEGQVALDIVEWRRLRAGEGEFPDYVDFLKRNPDWPGLEQLRAQGEGLIPEGADSQTVLAYFDGHPPVTGIGGLRLTQAYAALGRRGDAEAQAVLTWRTLPLAAPAHAALLDEYGKLLAPHHT
ncbi:MAG: lytic transglycosylase domain-containing protein, partial [Paracoccaceae bacterium]